ncbi:MAG: efflux RND transporter permease subunit [Spirochaetes bacterium]|nr:efflux RND transporter permease subunit [Spirochaetota bacterium]
MKISNIAIRRPVFTIMIYASILLLGFVSFGKLSLDFWPDMAFPMVIIMTQHPGVGPKEIETSITKIVEGSVASAESIDKLTATSKEGLSVVVVQFKWGIDLDAAIADLRDKLDFVRDYIPEDATKPRILKISSSDIPIAFYGLMGERPLPYLYDLAEYKVKDKIEQIKGVANLSIQGVRKKEIQVNLYRNRLDAYKITPIQIVNILKIENANVAGGNIDQGVKQLILRTEGEFKSIKEIRNIVIAYKRGIPVYLKNVAEVKWAVSEKLSVTKFNGQPGLRLIIRKQSGSNTVGVVRLLEKRMAEIRKTLPKGVKLVEMFNFADFIRQSISSVSFSAFFGGLFAILIVLLFLKDIRASLIIGLAIPVSVITTFIIMYFAKVSLNIVSLGGLALGIGMLVDNAIVVLENIFSHIKSGKKPAEAARLGTQEVGMAIISSTLTTVCVFLPIVFTEGLAKEIFMEMALTVSFSLMASLFVALTLIPLLAAKFLGKKKDSIKKKKSSFLKSGVMNLLNIIKTPFIYSVSKMRDGIDYLEKSYKNIISLALRRRKTVIFLSIFALILALGPIQSQVKKEFMPESDNANIGIKITLPAGTNLKTTTKAVTQLETIIKKIIPPEDLKTIFYIAGSTTGMAAIFNPTGTHKVSYRLVLVKKSLRNKSTSQYLKILKEGVKKAYAPLGIAEIKYELQGGAAMFGGGAPIDVFIRGNDLKKGAKLAKEINTIMEKIPELYNIDISRKEGVPELVLKVNRIKAANLGLNISTIASTIKQSVLGQVATYFRKDGREIDILVRLRKKDRQSISDLENIQIISGFTGKPIRLGNIAKFVRETGPIEIQRDTQERVIHVTASTFGGLAGSVAKIKSMIEEKVIIPAGFSLEYGGSFKDMQETFLDLALATLVAIFLVYAVMASIFNSFRDPLIIFFIIPLSLIGVFIALFITGTSLNINSFIGILVLAGIVVNNGIVLIDYINILRARGLSAREAIIEGGKRRMRPILMTSLTTILGLLPIAIGIGEGSEATSPLARSVIGGLTVATILSLIVIPVIYSLFEMKKEKKKKRCVS